MDEEVLEGIHIPPDIFLGLWYLPEGAYGISYDINTRKTQDNPPDGWNANRGEFGKSCKFEFQPHLSCFMNAAATYRALAKQLRLSDFEQLQYSDWINEDTNAPDAYMSMMSLMRINPPGKLQSTLKSVKIHYLADPRGHNGTDAMRLGGIYSPYLRGPTPANLVPGNVPAVAPLELEQLPRYTRPSVQAFNADNWRVQP